MIAAKRYEYFGHLDGRRGLHMNSTKGIDEEVKAQQTRQKVSECLDGLSLAQTYWGKILLWPSASVTEAFTCPRERSLNRAR